MRLFFVSFLFCLSLLVACEVPPLEETPDSDVNVTLQSRAEQIADIQWTPTAAVPTQGGFYSKGKTVSGIPYSSVKEEEKFVGQYVSFYTFMTAVGNPKSVIYSENVKEPPYHGTNCSTYYGTVCSMAVNYVLGIPFSFTTHDYKNLDCFEMVYPQSIESAKPGDILLQDKKHVVMVLDITRIEGRVKNVSILESTGGSGTRVDSYTMERLNYRWQRDGWELMRYKDLEKLASLEAMRFNDYPFDTPFVSPLCCSRGDRATFREGERIILNNLDERRHHIVVVKDNDMIGTIETTVSDISLDALSPGIYTFDLSNPLWDNPSVEVLETKVSAEKIGDNLTVSFSSCNSRPTSIIVTTISGARKLVQPLSKEEIFDGFKTIEIPVSSSQLYVKVMFEGSYGCVSNEPIPIL